MKSLYDAAWDTAQKYPDKDGLVFYGKRYSFSWVLKEIDRVADSLTRFVKKGDVVTVCMPNSVSAAVAVYAFNKIGCVLNLVHPFIPPENLKKSIAKTSSKLAVIYDLYFAKNQVDDLGVMVLKSACGHYMGGLKKFGYSLMCKKGKYYKTEIFERLKFYKKAEKADFTDDDPAVYLPSGGTTGEAKIIVHNCSAFNRLCANVGFFLSDDVDDYKAMYSVLPIFHGFGLCMNLHMCMYAGITNVMAMSFNPKDAANLIVREKVGILTGVPTMYAKLLRQEKFRNSDLSYLKECFVGGDFVPPSLIEQFEENLRKNGSGGKMYAGYGLTETVTVCTVNTKRHFAKDSVGIAVPSMKIAVAKDGKLLPDGEEGEIFVSGPIMMMGYMDGGENFVEIDGERWLATGDYGRVKDGFLYFMQRIKNIIKVSGINIYPSEIERAVMKIQGVRHAGAMAIADAEKGQVVKLFVEAVEGADEAELRRKIVDAIKSELIVYAVPKEIEFIKMPLSSVGKIDRKKLDDLCAN